MIPLQKALYLEMQKALTECQFLRDCTIQANDDHFVYCELVGALTQYLPANRCVIVIEKSRFSVAVVREKYEEIVCQWLQEAYDKSVDLARVPPKPRGGVAS